MWVCCGAGGGLNAGWQQTSAETSTILHAYRQTPPPLPSCFGLPADTWNALYASPHQRSSIKLWKDDGPQEAWRWGSAPAPAHPLPRLRTCRRINSPFAILRISGRKARQRRCKWLLARLAAASFGSAVRFTCLFWIWGPTVGRLSGGEISRFSGIVRVPTTGSYSRSRRASIKQLTTKTIHLNHLNKVKSSLTTKLM